MRGIKKTLALAGIATLAVAVPATAAPGGNGKGKAKGHDKVNAAKTCAKERKAMGKVAFGELYGKPAMKNCKAAAAEGDDDVTVKEKVNAAKECKAEQADPNFAATHDGKTFDEFYGTNAPNSKGKGAAKNAFGKCVSSKAKAKGEETPPPVPTP